MNKTDSRQKNSHNNILLCKKSATSIKNISIELLETHQTYHRRQAGNHELFCMFSLYNDS